MSKRFSTADHAVSKFNLDDINFKAAQESAEQSETPQLNLQKSANLERKASVKFDRKASVMIPDERQRRFTHIAADANEMFEEEQAELAARRKAALEEAEDNYSDDDFEADEYADEDFEEDEEEKEEETTGF